MPDYFAYGSNMDPEQMAWRVPAARPRGPARLPGYRFTCDKIGRDGTAKANLAPEPGGEVWGVLYILEATDLPELDRHEGGYRRAAVCVEAPDGSTRACETYLSTRTSADLLPTVAYRDRMVRGARAHGLPAQWQRLLEALPADG